MSGLTADLSGVPDLPVREVLGRVVEGLAAHGRLVLEAPPGAGKTTLVPLALDAAEGVDGRVVVLEPRRIAARAAADRMADLLGEPVGRTVGWTTGEGRRVSAATRIEVVTEGVLVRRLQRDPSLEGVAVVVLDEFHERAIEADLALALSLEAQTALRPDLQVLVMSATLDGDRVADLLGGAPVVRSFGRVHEVATLHRPGGDRTAVAEAVAAGVREALSLADGDVLAFLPGQREITRALGLLDGCGATVLPLYGALPADRQQAALRRVGSDGAGGAAGRRVVLATDIAESSLTVPGVRIVVDGGWARRPRFDPTTGMSGLRTVRVSRASADQRRGRAAREGPGLCVRLWPEHEALQATTPPAIAEEDLAPMALEVAAWGTAVEELALLDQPPPATWRTAQQLLADLGAVDAERRITDHGRAMAALPTHPRLASMVLSAPAELADLAADVAALLGERDVLPGAGTDLEARVALLRGGRSPRGGTVRRGGLDRVRRTADRIRRAVASSRDTTPSSRPPTPSGTLSGSGRGGAGRRQAEGGGVGGPATPSGTLSGSGRGGAGRRQAEGGGVGGPATPSGTLSGSGRGGAGRRQADEGGGRGGATPPDTAVGQLVARAYPDRIGLSRGRRGAFVLAGGRGAVMAEGDALAGEPMIAVAQLDRGSGEARIHLAAALDPAVAEADARDVDVVSWQGGDVVAERQRRVGALVLGTTSLPDPPRDAVVAALLQGIREEELRPLPWTAAATGLRERLHHLHRQSAGDGWPPVDDQTLLDQLEGWLVPFLGTARRRGDLSRIDLPAALLARVPYDLHRQLDAQAPTHLEVPTGSRIRVDYSGDRPVLAVKLQELFGLRDTPTVAGRPVLLHLLSPARRPVQITDDLGGFWTGSYAAVRADMRGRYPKHPWPEDPTDAAPTRHTTRRSSRRP